MRRSNLLILGMIFLSFNAISQNKERVIIKYKKYEKFDMGDLSITGNILTPGDLSVKDRKDSVLTGELYKRRKFEEKIINELQDLY